MAKNYGDRDKIRILQELDGGARISDLSRKYGISRSTIHRWQRKFMTGQQPLPRLEESPAATEARKPESDDAYVRRLEAENMRLKRIVVQQALKIDALQDLVGRRTDCCT